VTQVTATKLSPAYLLLIEAPLLRPRGARAMTKFYSLILAALLLAPVAFATLNQAAQIVA
jgi:hypothetical protein